MFGLPLEATNLEKVALNLQDKANLEDVIIALRNKIPTLEGTVISSNENRLLENCAFNIDGRFYNTDDEFLIEDGAHLILLTLATGG